MTDLQDFLVQHGAEFVVAGGMVAIYAVKRFRTPPTNRTTTTVYRYYVGMCAYLAFSLAVLGGLTAMIEIAPPLAFLSAGIQDDLRALSSPILAALLMTSLLPSWPGLQMLDSEIRRGIQALASIPFGVLSLASRLREFGYMAPDGLHETTRRRLADLGVEDADVEFADESRTAQFIWTKAVALGESCRRWRATSRRSAAFFHAYEAQWNRIEQSFTEIGADVARYFHHSRVLPRDARDSGIGELLNDSGASIDRAIGKLDRDMRLFVSRGVLWCTRSKRGRDALLTSLGYQGEFVPSLSFHQIVAMFLLLFGMLILGLGISRGSVTGDYIEASRLSLMIAVAYIVSVAWAVYPRGAWRVASRSREGARPWGFYALAAGLAMLSGACIVLVYHLLASGGHAIEEWRKDLPWLLLCGVSAFGVGFQLDTRWPAQRVWGLPIRVLEGLAFGAALALANFAALFLLEQLENLPESQLGAVLTSSAIGIALGITVPTWFRRLPTSQSRELEVGLAQELPESVGAI